MVEPVRVRYNRGADAEAPAHAMCAERLGGRVTAHEHTSTSRGPRTRMRHVADGS